MKSKRLGLLLSSLLLSVAATAHAGDKPRPIQGKAPPKRIATAQPAPTEAYDISSLDPVDAATKQAISVLAERCLTSELSREGPTQEEIAKCAAAVGSVRARGKTGASAILAALNESGSALRPVARRRLYGVLGQIDDERVRSVIIDGLSKIGRDKLDAYAMYRSDIDGALRSMCGAGPAQSIPWEGPVVVLDTYAEVSAAAAAWREFRKANEGKGRAQITQETLATARADKKSDDPKRAYRAIEALLQHAPKEALGAVKAYRKRSDLSEKVADAFESLETRISDQLSWEAERRAR